jgi:hypothetical protein
MAPLGGGRQCHSNESGRNVAEIEGGIFREDGNQTGIPGRRGATVRVAISYQPVNVL